MKNTKRFLSVILAIALAFTMAIAVSAEEAQTTASTSAAITLSDIDPATAVGKAVNKLVSVGIINGYEDGTYRPDNTITRAEFAKVIAVFLGLGEFASDSPSGFQDVDGVNHWAQKYIKLAVDKGIVLGYEDGTFRPDNPVKYSEAIKMVVCALGYGEVATRRAVAGTPWYSSYVTLAGELKLLTNTAINNYEDEASRGNVAIIIYNALDAEVANTTTSSTGKTSTQGTGKTAQETFLKAKDMKGIVVSCYQTSLSKASSSNKERFINVDEGDGEINKYRVPEGTDTYALLGYEIEASVDDDDAASDYKDITGLSKTKNNEVKTINPDDISSVDENGIKYWTSDSATKATNMSFGKNMVIIYNGRYLGTLDEVGADIFDINAGKLVFISNDGDSKPEVAFVNDCEVFAVSSAGTDSATKLKKIYTLYGGGDILVPDKGTVIKINNKGTNVNPGESFNVAKYDVINLYRSMDGEVFDMTVTKNKVSGTISEVGSDGTITINKKEYKLAYNLENYNGDDKPTFARNTSANVYTDIFGQIAAAEKLSTVEGTNVNVGYIIKVGKGDAIDAKCEASIYGLAGKTGQLGYNMASKVKIDGTSYSSNDEIIEALQTSADVANATKYEKKDSITKTLIIKDYNQLIKYTLNSKGEIDTIDTVLPNVNEATDDLNLSLVYPNNADARYDGTWDGRYQYVSGNLFQGEGGKNVMGVNSQTKVLVIPEDMGDKDKYRVTSYSYFSSSQYYRVEGYNFNATNVAAYVLVYAGKDATDFTYSSDIVITKSVTQASSSSSSELEDKLVGWNLKNGNDVSNLRSESDVLFGNVTAGEIMRYTLDDSKVDKMEMVLEKDNNGMPVLFSGNKKMNALDPVADAATAKAQRTVQYDAGTRSATASVCKLVYGTVLTKESENNTNSITLTSTVLTDECGVDDTDKQIFNMDSTTKYFVVDFTQTKEDDIASSGVEFDEIRSLKEVDGDVNEASQVLLFYNAGKIKTVVIVKANYGVG